MATKELPDYYMRKYLGYKFFKELPNGEFEIVRITKTFVDNSIKLLKENGDIIKVPYTYLESYTPLKPTYLASFNLIGTNIDNNLEMKDVLVCIYKIMNLEINDQMPFAICRQAVHDFFADLLYQDPEKENNYFGISCSIENCPTNVNYQELSYCDRVIKADLVNFYKDDTIDTILQCVPHIDTFDRALSKLLKEHCKYRGIAFSPTIQMDQGWCKSTKLLLDSNNFEADLNSMEEVTGVDFILADYLEKREDGVFELTRPATLFFDEVFKVNATQTRVIEYNYGIDMSKFNNMNYVFLRDKEKKLYLVVYLAGDQYLEEELRKEAEKLDVTDKFRLSYFNKYSKNKESN